MALFGRRRILGPDLAGTLQGSLRRSGGAISAQSQSPASLFEGELPGLLGSLGSITDAQRAAFSSASERLRGGLQRTPKTIGFLGRPDRRGSATTNQAQSALASVREATEGARVVQGSTLVRGRQRKAQLAAFEQAQIL